MQQSSNSGPMCNNSFACAEPRINESSSSSCSAPSVNANHVSASISSKPAGQCAESDSHVMNSPCDVHLDHQHMPCESEIRYLSYGRCRQVSATIRNPSMTTNEVRHELLDEHRSPVCVEAMTPSSRADTHGIQPKCFTTNICSSAAPSRALSSRTFPRGILRRSLASDVSKSEELRPHIHGGSPTCLGVPGKHTSRAVVQGKQDAKSWSRVWSDALICLKQQTNQRQAQTQTSSAEGTRCLGSLHVEAGGGHMETKDAHLVRAAHAKHQTSSADRAVIYICVKTFFLQASCTR
jgi:hypothetical protein